MCVQRYLAKRDTRMIGGLICVLLISDDSTRPVNKFKEGRELFDASLPTDCSATSSSNRYASLPLLRNLETLRHRTCPPSVHLLKRHRNNQEVWNRKLRKGSGDKMSKFAWHTLVLFLGVPVLRHGVVSHLKIPDLRLELVGNGRLYRLFSAPSDMHSQPRELARPSKV